MVSYVASLVLLCLTQLRVNGYVLKGNEWIEYDTLDDTVLDNYTIYQSAGMQGRILCNGKPFKRAIRLVAQDVGILKDGPAGRWNYWSDGLYENEATDDDALFRLSGWAPKHKVRGVETGKSVIYLHVYHRCVQNESRGEWSLPHTEEYKDFDFMRNCVRKYKSADLPGNFVSEGKVPEKIYDLGTIDLAVEHDYGQYACGGCGGYPNPHRGR